MERCVNDAKMLHLDAPPNVRSLRGKSGRGADLSVCPLMTQSGLSGLCSG